MFKWEFPCGDGYTNLHVIKFHRNNIYIYIYKVHIKTGDVLITSVLKLTTLFPH